MDRAGLRTLGWTTYKRWPPPRTGSSLHGSPPGNAHQRLLDATFMFTAAAHSYQGRAI
ncbi:hypothetical protein ACFYWN_43330 [Streptomyces sp. NPDC002917]|uniref:hypothetical protein n=1 Tax=Streptomyces sp. NPDC002917 TaxID=3364671 RepID=UPI0036CA050C